MVGPGASTHVAARQGFSSTRWVSTAEGRYLQDLGIRGVLFSRTSLRLERGTRAQITCPSAAVFLAGIDLDGTVPVILREGGRPAIYWSSTCEPGRLSAAGGDESLLCAEMRLQRASWTKTEIEGMLPLKASFSLGGT